MRYGVYHEAVIILDGRRATPPAQAGDYVTATPLYMYIFTVHQYVRRLELINSFYMILLILLFSSVKFFHFAPIILYKIIIHNVCIICHMLNSSRDTLLDLEPTFTSVQKLWAVATGSDCSRLCM